MWIIRGIILLIGAVALIWLGTKNAGTKVTFYLFNKTYPELELNLILVLSFISGMIVWAIGSWIREAQLMIRLMKEKKKSERLMEEISDLRNIPLGEEPIEDEDIQ